MRPKTKIINKKDGSWTGVIQGNDVDVNVEVNSISTLLTNCTKISEKLTFEEKIKAHIAKNGIKTFGYKPEDLDVFSLPELRQLRDNGLTGDEDVVIRAMGDEA